MVAVEKALICKQIGARMPVLEPSGIPHTGTVPSLGTTTMYQMIIIGSRFDSCPCNLSTFTGSVRRFSERARGGAIIETREMEPSLSRYCRGMIVDTALDIRR